MALRPTDPTAPNDRTADTSPDAETAGGHPAAPAHTTQTEIERKYAVDAEQLPDLVGVGDASGAAIVGARTHEPFVLEAVYYDTPDLALARARIALRRREGGHDEGWHVKLPAAEGRTELQWPLGTGDVPRAVRAAVLVHVRDRPLTPLAMVRTRRTITELLDPADAVVVEIADDSVTGTDSREGSVRLWREWEAELGPAAPATADGRTQLLDAIEKRLLDAGATVSPSVSKLAQALGRTGLGAAGPGTSGLRAGRSGSSEGGAADAAATAEPDAHTVVVTGIRELVDKLIELDPAVRVGAHESVHRQRTVVRRLRSVLAGHKRLFSAGPLQTVRESLARFGGVLGEVRDLEVRADWAEAELDAVRDERGIDDRAARDRLVASTRLERDSAHDRLVEWMSAAPYFRLLDGLDELLSAKVSAAGSPGGGGSRASGLDPVDGSGVDSASGGLTDPAVTGGGSARRESKAVIRRAARKADRLSVRRSAAKRVLSTDAVTSAQSEVALHDSRKSARRLRHLAEFATSSPAAALGGSAERLGEAAERLQDALGEHRDALLFGEFVRLIAPRADAAGESSFVYGVLYQRSLDRARAALDAAGDARKELRDEL